MPKSSRGTLLGIGSGGRGTAIIEVAVRQRHTRRAKAAFLVTTGAVGLLAATVTSQYLHPILGLLLGLLIGAVTGATVAAVILIWPVLRVFWHWTFEIVATLLLVSGWQALMHAANLAAALTVVALLFGVPASLRPIRRRLAGWTWCVIDRHRLRVCFAAFIATNRHGTLPLILLARPTPAGERVWIWLRPGLSIKDLEVEGQLKKLAVACWAKEVRVSPASEHYAALVRIDITRRDPLTATVGSPLPALIPDGVPATAPATEVPSGGLDLPDVPDVDDDATTPANRRRKTRETATTGSAINTGHGPDLSDYV